MSYEAFTDANPLMPALANAAEQVRENRKPVAADNPFLAAQEKVSEQIVKALDAWRETPGETLRADVPRDLRIAGASGCRRRQSRRPPGREGRENPCCIGNSVEKRIAELKSQITKGGLQECTIRGLVYVGMARGFVDERGVAALRRIRLTEEGSRLTLAQFKAMAREQFFLLLLEPEATLAAIPKLLPADVAERRKGLAAIRNVLSAAGEISGEAAERLKKVTALFEVNEAEPSGTAPRRSLSFRAQTGPRHRNAAETIGSRTMSVVPIDAATAAMRSMNA